MSVFWQLLHKRIHLVILTISISIISILISLWWNEQLSLIINKMNDKDIIPASIILKAAFTILISTGLAYVLGILSGWTCETLTHDLRMGYARHFASLPIKEIENLNAGEYLSRLQNEITDVSGYMHMNLFPIIDDGIRFAATYTWMLRLNPKLTILAHLPVIFILCYIIYSSRIMEGLTNQSQEANVQMNGFADTLINVFPILRIFNAAGLLCSKYNEALSKWETAGIREERTRAKLMSLSALLSCIPLLLLFFIGGSQVVDGKFSIGNLYIFINLSGNVSGILMNLPGRVSALRRFTANMKRLQTSVLITKGGK